MGFIRHSRLHSAYIRGTHDGLCALHMPVIEQCFDEIEILIALHYIGSAICSHYVSTCIHTPGSRKSDRICVKKGRGKGALSATVCACIAVDYSF